MRDDVTITGWKEFADMVKGLWGTPTEHDFAALTAASLKHEEQQDALVASQTPAVLPPRTQQATQLAVWEDEGGTTAHPTLAVRPETSPPRNDDSRPVSSR